MSIARLAAGKNVHTHIQVTGTVTLVKHEKDGDLHIRIVDGKGNFLIAECIPKLPCKVTPKKGQTVTIRGIYRFDGEHKWYEAHPVEDIEIQ